MEFEDEVERGKILIFVVCDFWHGVSNIYMYVEKCKYIYVNVCVGYF